MQSPNGLLVSAVVRDITDRKRSEELFRGLLDSAPDAMVVVDDRGRIVLVNSQTEKLFGYRRDELLQQPVEALIPERFWTQHRHHRTSYTAHAQFRPMGVGLELYGMRKDGSEFPLEISLSPQKTKDGVLISSTIRDITDRKKVEDALGRARAAVDEATAREARRLVEKAIEETDEGAGSREQGAGWMSLEDLKRARKPSTNLHRPPPSSTTPGPAVNAATEISLIGLRVSEAEPLLVKALDDAILADLPYLRVVHGKGTGALRQLVHDVLSGDQRVRRFGFAAPNQGGSGVTVVEFKA